VKKTREFHDNESENISGKSIRGAALINFFAPDVALIRVNMVCHSILLTGSKVRNFAELDYYMYPALCMMVDYL